MRSHISAGQTTKHKQSLYFCRNGFYSFHSDEKLKHKDTCYNKRDNKTSHKSISEFQESYEKIKNTIRLLC
ncbi:hypothetical protein B4U80_07179 [Leptotrombidium deliense]|uniref:Uncharacterized protein n=1 Tax=Leptotrombidium deliense TaxID=299467 RepID=A0A443RZ12_9ACAR|nr:hypothetical protein B4U80_07179 [Leptotrombidium deliense]